MSKALWPHVFGFPDAAELPPFVPFKVEREAENKLPFLDTLVHRSPDHFFSLYGKPMPCGMHIHLSYHPPHVKRDVATSLFLRICGPSTWKERSISCVVLSSNCASPFLFSCSRVIQGATYLLPRRRSQRDSLTACSQSVLRQGDLFSLSPSSPSQPQAYLSPGKHCVAT